MWGNTYIASCNYLTELSYSAVQSGTGSCYDLSNGVHQSPHNTSQSVHLEAHCVPVLFLGRRKCYESQPSMQSSASGLILPLQGFVYLFCAHGLIGVMYMFVVLVGIRGSKAWSEENYQASI